MKSRSIAALTRIGLAILWSDAGLSVAACAPGAPERSCATLVWSDAKTDVSVIGSWDDWAEPGTPLTPTGEGSWKMARLTLPPGEHGYLLRDEHKTFVDPYNPYSTWREEGSGADETPVLREVSLTFSPDCSIPEVRLDRVETSGDDGRIEIAGTFLRSAGGALLDPAALSAIDARGGELSVKSADPATGAFVLEGSGFARGKHRFSIGARDVDGGAGEGPEAIAWVAPAARSWADGLVYQIMIDRFRGDNGAALAAPETPGHRAGGTLDGIRAELEKGTFEKMGVSVLWLSPVYENPVEMRVGRDGQLYEGYHGYWPKRSQRVDGRIGGEAALSALMEEAHQRGIRVLFDLVPNHVYETNERYVDHAEDGWFNDGEDACVCGAPGCPWGDRILDCWFTPYLPDVRWESAPSLRAQIDDALFWMKEFDADGARVDAVPMMPRAATRRLLRPMRKAVFPARPDPASGDAPEQAFFSLGEVYVGPGESGTDTIRYHLGEQGLDSAFDFPLMWAMHDVLAAGKAGFDTIESSLAYTEESWRGSGTVVARMVDNHDTVRFLSIASGNPGADAWNNPAPQPDDEAPYRRLRLGLALLLTLPGLPVIYYGDEVGLAGGSDPDCRRVMPEEGALSASQRLVRETTERLGAVRQCLAALRTGERSAFLIAERHYGFVRDAGDGSPALVLFSSDTEAAQIVPPLKVVPAGTYVDAITSEAFEVGSGAAVPMNPLDFRLLLPEKHPCLAP